MQLMNDRAVQLMNAWFMRDRGWWSHDDSKLFYISTNIIRDDREFQMRWWQILQDSLLFDGLIAARRGTKGSKYCWQIWLIDLSNNWLIERAMQLMNAIQRDRGSIPRRSKLFYISTYIIRDDREFQAETKFTKQTNDKKVQNEYHTRGGPGRLRSKY